MTDHFDAIVITGPTACGKTAIAVEVARRIQGEIISADSRQVYRGMDIGSGKDIGTYGSVPAHCIDRVEPTEVYTLRHFLDDARSAFDGIARRGSVPIICGGTGLYVEAILKGYQLSAITGDDALRETLMLLPADELRRRLERYPDILARTDTSSRKRMARSLEIALAGGDHGTAGEPMTRHPLTVLITAPRDEVKRRISARLDARLDGIIEETRALHDAGVSIERLKSFGMEYRRGAEFIGGEIDASEFRNLLERDIHRLAKRQMTWFRGMERRGTPLITIDITAGDATTEILRRWNAGAAQI